MKENETSDVPAHWFPAKRFGWGWGLPIAWQGWAVLAVYFLLLVGGGAMLVPRVGTEMFAVYAMCLSAVLLAVCWVKGERPRWRWREP